MNKKIVALLIGALLIPTGYAEARGGYGHGGGHGNDFGRVVGYTAAAVLTAGVVGSLCCSNNRSYGYDRGYRDAQYDYYSPPPVVYYAPPPRQVYYAPPQPVYYQQPVYQQPVYVQQRPVYYGY